MHHDIVIIPTSHSARAYVDWMQNQLRFLLAFLSACGASSNNPSDSGNADGAKSEDADGNAADAPHDASSDGALFVEPLGVNLSTAGNYAMLAMTGISTVPTSNVTGNLGLSPAAASYITGFSLTADATNVFATSPQVTGKVYASDYMPPTPSNLTTAISDMQLAFTDAAGRAPDVTELRCRKYRRNDAHAWRLRLEHRAPRSDGPHAHRQRHRYMDISNRSKLYDERGDEHQARRWCAARRTFSGRWRAPSTSERLRTSKESSWQ